MALQKILHNIPETPYSRPPPVHITVLDLKEQVKVLSWVFDDTEARASVSKKNIIAVISDGVTVAKITLFEAFASKIKAGQAYIMRGYTLRGDCPYMINVTKDTVFFRSAPVEVSPSLKVEASKLLCPVSHVMPLSDARKADGLITIQGEVVEISSIKRTQVGRDTVPLRSVTIKEDQTQVIVNLWREAAVLPLQVGSHARLTHLKPNESSYGFRLQSTTHTLLKDTTETTVVSAMGAAEWVGRPGILKLLVEGDKVLEIQEALWLPLQEQLKNLPFYVKVSLSGKTVLAAEALPEAEAKVN